MISISSLVYGVLFLGGTCLVIGLATVIMSALHFLDMPTELEEEMISYDLFADLDKSVSKRKL